MLSATSICAKRNQNSVIDDLSFDVPAGSALQVTGANGSGKSTLLRVLAGLMPPAFGQIRWKGQDISEVLEDYHRAVSYLGHRIGVKEGLTVKEQVLFSQALLGQNGRRIEGILRRFGLQGEQNRVASTLSRGQKQRLAFCRLGLSGTALWLLDEPFTAIDQDAKKNLESMMIEHVKNSGALVFTSHQAVVLPDIQLKTICL